MLGGNVFTAKGSGNNESTQVFTGLDNGDCDKKVVINGEKNATKGTNIKTNVALHSNGTAYED